MNDSTKSCIEVRTPNCPRCNMFEPEFQRLQSQFPQYEYKVVVFGIDPEARELAVKYSIMSAPTFIVSAGNSVEVVKQEELEQTLVKYAD